MPTKIQKRMKFYFTRRISTFNLIMFDNLVRINYWTTSH